MSHHNFSRRDLLILGLSLSSAGMTGHSVLAQTPTPSEHPDAAKFQSGDFLWPARQGSFFPFARTRSLGANPEEREWEAEKRRFIEQARASADPDQIAAAEQLEQISFEQFRALYFEDAGAPRTRGFSPFAAALPEVGHVAIIEIDAAGVRWVVEAMPKAPNRYESLYSRFQNGVIRTRYDEWIKNHPAEVYNIWHGRLRDIKPGQGDQIVNAAKQFLGRDYWFWSFDLSDYSGFYCSKLVWVSVWNSLSIALDGDSSFPRKFWVTPKTLINSNLVEVLHDPVPKP
jgi:hypothetical protein